VDRGGETAKLEVHEVVARASSTSGSEAFHPSRSSGSALEKNGFRFVGSGPEAGTIELELLR